MIRMTPEEGKLSHYVTVTNRFGQEINVPVIDVRDGIVAVSYTHLRAHET
jgi:hypothetical protein